MEEHYGAEYREQATHWLAAHHLLEPGPPRQLLTKPPPPPLQGHDRRTCHEQRNKQGGRKNRRADRGKSEHPDRQLRPPTKSPRRSLAGGVHHLRTLPSPRGSKRSRRIAAILVGVGRGAESTLPGQFGNGTCRARASWPSAVPGGEFPDPMPSPLATAAGVADRLGGERRGTAGAATQGAVHMARGRVDFRPCRSTSI
jgi:hypothetical protein